MDKVDKILKAFKDGVADALQAGYQAEFHEQMHYYKQGYDFGISQYSELKKLEGEYEQENCIMFLLKWIGMLIYGKDFGTYMNGKKPKRNKKDKAGI